MFKKNFLRKLKDKSSQKIKEYGFFRCIFFMGRTFFVALMVLVIFMVLRLLRPLLFIRFGSLYADKIGPLISRPGFYLCEKDQNIQPQNTLDIFHDGYGENRHVCNHFLLNKWKKIFSARKGVFLMNGFAKVFFDFAEKNSFAKDHIIKLKIYGRDILGLVEKSDIQLQFTEEEIFQAESDIRKMGIEVNSSYVCMINRDQQYLENTFPSRNWQYHSYRNCSIQDYMLAAEELTKKGYSVIRMGSIVKELMKTDNPRIIEYARGGFRTELLDIYLSAKCEFFISVGTGLDAIPWICKRPEIYVNFSAVEYIHSWIPNGLTIFKKYWLKNEKRFMSIKEAIESGAGKMLFAEEYEKMGIELIGNTPEEIRDVVDEMVQRLNGTWNSTPEDDELQEVFWSHFKSSPLHGPIRAKIGSKFLRENQDLLIPKKITC